MSDKDKLLLLINEPFKPSLSDWVYEVEAFLKESNNETDESTNLIKKVKFFGEHENNAKNLLSLLKILYKRKYDSIELPPITKRNQIFVAMMFSKETDSIYNNVYKPLIQNANYSAMRIDEKIYTGSIINEITTEISDSVALIADLTGNRGGVYYEAGIAKGLQLCNHKIKLILTCNKEFFEKENVHFDVSGDNILLYDSEEDLRTKLPSYLNTIKEDSKK